MKTSIAILGIMAAAYGASKYLDEDKSIDSPLQQELKNPKLQTRWNISRADHSQPDHPQQCIFKTLTGSSSLTAMAQTANCDKVIAGLDQLAHLEINPNGDITLYNKQGDPLAKFIETDSATHDSIWPTYPLLTLAKLD